MSTDALIAPTGTVINEGIQKMEQNPIYRLTRRQLDGETMTGRRRPIEPTPAYADNLNPSETAVLGR